MIKAISLFSCAGIGELSLANLGVSILAANELIEKRAAVYEALHTSTKMIVGDIKDRTVKSKLFEYVKEKPELLLATPPCQGLSTVGKNKIGEHYSIDERNFLINDVIEVVKAFDFKYILIENVPKYLEMHFPKNGQLLNIIELLKLELGNRYSVEGKVLNAKHYGVPQSRPRSIIKLCKHGLNWPDPQKQPVITLEESIGNLPSLRPGEKSNLRWHYAKPQAEQHTLALMHTPTGKSALQNSLLFPTNKFGEKVKGFHNTYKRMLWHEPAHARTTYNGSISSHNNIHPGRLLSDGTYSDPRVLSLLETFIVSTIDPNTTFPDTISESFLRTLIGEGVPPKFMFEILKPALCQ